MNAPVFSDAALTQVHHLLENFGSVASSSPSLAHLAQITKGLDPRQQYPQSLRRSDYENPLGHMINLLQDYFHGADVGHDEDIRRRLFEMVSDLLVRHGDIEKDIGWVVPQMLESLAFHHGWNSRINPAGCPYAIGAGRALAPVMPRHVRDVILTGQAGFAAWPKTGDNAWDFLETVSPEYREHFVEGALPVLCSQGLDCEVAQAQEPPSRTGPRL